MELLWDESAMAQVVTGIGYSSKGQQGCCVAGMWCNAATASCETHHFGRTFVNHGWVGGEDDLAPVYTCEDLDAGEKAIILARRIAKYKPTKRTFAEQKLGPASQSIPAPPLGS